MDRWRAIAQRLIREHPLSEEDIVDVVLESWDQIFKSRIGKLRIGKEIRPSPQIMSFFLHELVAHNLQEKLPRGWRLCQKKGEKDLVCINDDKYSVEIKASSHPTQIFGNRSYAQERTTAEQAKKSGYYLCINFEKFVEDSRPEIVLIRFGHIDHSDWIAQTAPTGQQARLSQQAYEYKLKELYRRETFR